MGLNGEWSLYLDNNGAPHGNRNSYWFEAKSNEDAIAMVLYTNTLPIDMSLNYSLGEETCLKFLDWLEFECKVGNFQFSEDFVYDCHSPSPTDRKKVMSRLRRLVSEYTVK